MDSPSNPRHGHREVRKDLLVKIWCVVIEENVVVGKELRFRGNALLDDPPHHRELLTCIRYFILGDDACSSDEFESQASFHHQNKPR